jgi:hypothetical protein
MSGRFEIFSCVTGIFATNQAEAAEKEIDTGSFLIFLHLKAAFCVT